MKYHLISDSCCDLTEDTQSSNGISIVPLSITIDENLYMDDGSLNIPQFLFDMRHARKMTSGAPSPGAYLGKLQKDAVNFIVTLSSRLSGSFTSAVTAMNIAQEEAIDVHVFDSLSATAGQMLVVRKLQKLIRQGLEKPKIISKVEAYIQGVQTIYAAQDLSNLIKNGRLGKVTGKLLSVLGIRPILASNGDGELTLKTHARGDRQTLSSLLNLVTRSKTDRQGELIITHCNNPELAERLREKLEQTFDFTEIIVAHTRGLSSMYANDRGLVIAF